MLLENGISSERSFVHGSVLHSYGKLGLGICKCISQKKLGNMGRQGRDEMHMRPAGPCLL